MGPFKLSLTKREGWNFENFEKSDYFVKPFLGFVGAIVRRKRQGEERRPQF